MKKLLLAFGFVFLVVSCGGGGPKFKQTQEAVVTAACEDAQSMRIPCYWTDSEGWVDMGVPFSADGSIAEAMNDQGMIVGWVDDAQIPGLPANNSVGWTWTEAGGHVQIVNPTGGDVITYDVNDSGVVVGQFDDASGISTVDYAGIWDGSTMTFLPHVDPAAQLSTAYGVNNEGDVVGSSGSHVQPTAVFWEWNNGGWTVTDLGMLDPGHSHSEATAISDTGLIVGNSGTLHPVHDATAWYMEIGGPMTAVPDCGNGVQESSANDVNNRGRVVGHIRDGNGDDFAYEWTLGDAEAICFAAGGEGIAINGFDAIVGDDHPSPPASSGWMAFVPGLFGTMAAIPADPGGLTVDLYVDIGRMYLSAVEKDVAWTWTEAGGYVQIVNPDNVGPSSHMVSTYPQGVSDDGVAVGRFDKTSGSRGGIWDGSTMTYLPELVPHLATTEAWGVNKHGAVVGWSTPSPPTWEFNAVLWEYASGWTITNLGLLDPSHNESQATAISDTGLIVGISGISQGHWTNPTAQRAWYMEPGGSMTAVPDCGNGVQLSAASDVNENDLVVGHITDGNGDGFAYAWTLGDAQATCFAADAGAHDVNENGQMLVGGGGGNVSTWNYTDGTNFNLIPIPDPTAFTLYQITDIGLK